MTEEEEAETLVGELLLDAQEAREDPAKFLAFVMRDEKTGDPIVPAPHQLVMMSFLYAHKTACCVTHLDAAKTFGSAALVLFLLGHNPNLRIILVGDIEDQPKKVLKVIRTMLESSAELHLVFPDLRKTRRDGEPWSDSSLTVDRPLGIKDPSITAVGITSGKVPGSRFDVVVLDDFVNDENTRTPERREELHKYVQTRFIGRVDMLRGRVYMLSNAWHPEDSFQRHARVYPTLTMRVDGIIMVRNAPDWDSPLIRPADDRDASNPLAQYRLIAHDPDPDGLVPLWPERFPAAFIEERREKMLPVAFAQTYLCECRDYSESLCRPEYIERAKEVADKLKITGFYRRKADVDVPTGQGLIFIGVDLAFSKQASADESAFFTLMCLPGQIRLPLWIEHGRWGAEELEKKFLDHADRYPGAVFVVENVGAQEHVRQFLQRIDKNIAVKPFTTDKTKHNVFYGIPAIFAEYAAGVWAFPNRNGVLRPEMQKFADQSLGYTPSDHTGDVLMAGYFASEMAKKFGALAKNQGPLGAKGGIGAAVKMR
jgi:hypothetical protein